MNQLCKKANEKLHAKYMDTNQQKTLIKAFVSSGFF